MKIKNFAQFFVLISLFAAASIFAQDTIRTVIPSQALNLIKNDSTLVLLDVRTPAEYNSESGHLQNALLIPLQELENRVDELNKFKNKDILVYCRTGHRSAKASELLLKHGYKVYNMAGGINKWNAEGLPVVKEEQK